MTTKQKPKQQPLDPATIEVEGRYIYDSGRGTRLLVSVEYLYADRGEATVRAADRYYGLPSGWTYGRKGIKLNRLVATEQQEKHLHNVAKFWAAKRAGRKRVAQLKEWAKEEAENKELAELREVNEFVKTAGYLAEQLERRAQDIRQKAQRAIDGRGYRNSFVEQAGDILVEYAGNSGNSAVGSLITEAIDADEAARAFRKERRDAERAEREAKQVAA